jgi:hypothetical protein
MREYGKIYGYQVIAEVAGRFKYKHGCDLSETIVIILVYCTSLYSV